MILSLKRDIGAYRLKSMTVYEQDRYKLSLVPSNINFYVNKVVLNANVKTKKFGMQLQRNGSVPASILLFLNQISRLKQIDSILLIRVVSQNHKYKIHLNLSLSLKRRLC